MAIAVGIELLNHRHDRLKLLGRDNAVPIDIKDGKQRIGRLIASGTSAGSTRTSTPSSARAAGSARRARSAANSSQSTGTPGCACRTLFPRTLVRCPQRNCDHECQPCAKHPSHLCHASFHLLFLGLILCCPWP
ncbi:MAG: hypothetical protein ACKVP0_20225 [Pirellulaceae bacterium]